MDATQRPPTCVPGLGSCRTWAGVCGTERASGRAGPTRLQTALAQPEALRGRRQALRAESAPGAAGAAALLRPGVARALVLLARPAHRAAAAAWPAAGGGGAAGARAAALAALDLLHAPFCAAATPGAVLRDLQAVRARAAPGSALGQGMLRR